MLFSQAKWPGLEADHSPPSSAKVKKVGDTPSYVFMEWCLIKYKGNFTFLRRINPQKFRKISSQQGSVVTEI
jgi:hypothetical protein